MGTGLKVNIAEMKDTGNNCKQMLKKTKHVKQWHLFLKSSLLHWPSHPSGQKLQSIWEHLTSISFSLNSMIVRAFCTVFQSLLSLMELTLAHSPCPGNQFWTIKWICFMALTCLCICASHLNKIAVFLTVSFQTKPAKKLILPSLN